MALESKELKPAPENKVLIMAITLEICKRFFHIFLSLSLDCLILKSNH